MLPKNSGKDTPNDVETSPLSGVAFDIRANRSSRKWTRKQLFGRAIWEVIGARLFRWSPRPAWAWRRAILRRFGATIGRNVHLDATVRIKVPWNLIIREQAAVGEGAIIYNLGVVTIGSRATVSQNAHLCAGSHDYLSSSFDLTKPPIDIGDDAWICADAFVGPGVRVGARSIIGARAVVVRDLPSDLIAAGNPARVIKERPVILS